VKPQNARSSAEEVDTTPPELSRAGTCQDKAKPFLFYQGMDLIQQEGQFLYFVNNYGRTCGFCLEFFPQNRWPERKAHVKKGSDPFS
jgi:hypothetical protein